MTPTLTPTDDDTRIPAAPPVPEARTGRERTALGVLLAGTAVLYLWNLGASGFANTFYAAAVQAGTKNWEALLFGSLDTGDIITVDKPPASLWVMSLSGRIFGFNSWSMLVPEALMGVATVALIYAAVRRVSGPRAALLAGTAMALTPVAVLMFRYNNPDALLVLLMVAAAYATVRAIERARIDEAGRAGRHTRWLVLAGVLLGFAFLAKLGQALVVLPALALVYLIAAPTGFWRRIRQLLLGGLAVVVSAGWYVVLTELWPADSRPYIGGSVGNSLLQLALGYNGLGRIFGGSGDPGGGGLPGGGADIGAGLGGGEVGIGRMFGSEIGGQVGWLLPAALALLVAGLWTTRRAPRTDPTRASLILWGGWTLITMVVFSFAEGIFHSYYTVALAPGIAGLVGVGGHELWKHRATWAGRAALAVVVAGTAAWAWVLLGRSAAFLPWLRWVVVVLAVVAVVALLVPVSGRRRTSSHGGTRQWRWAGVGALAVVLTSVAGPAAYAVDTMVAVHNGSLPAAGPAMAGGRGGFPGAGPPGQGTPGGGRQRGAGGAGGGVGGGFEAEATDPALAALLRASTTKWSAATVGAMGGAGLALSSDSNVMTIGGFMGSDPAPTLQQFQAYVAAGDVHYLVETGGLGGAQTAEQLPEQVPDAVRGDSQFQQFPDQARQGGRGGTSSEITTWVQQNFTSSTVGGRTVYDLTQHK